MSDTEIKNENLIEGETTDTAKTPQPTDEKQTDFFSDISPSSQNSLPVGRQLLVIGVIMLGIFTVGGFAYFDSFFNKGRQQEQVSPTLVSNESDGPLEERANDPFAGINLGAESVLVFDIRNQAAIYERSADQKWPLASITKLMTALVAHEIVDNNLVVPITKEALEQSGDSGLKEGQRFSLGRLMDMILLTSSNDGAFALAAAAGSALDPASPAEAFVKAMNVRAKELGLDDTYFRNPTGLDISKDEAGAYGTARDVAKLVEYIFKHYPELLQETTEDRAEIQDLSGLMNEARNTNPVVDEIPGAIGSKTGYTTLSGGNLAVVFNAGADRPIVVVVLGSSHQGRFSDVLQLINATKEKLINEQ